MSLIATRPLIFVIRVFVIVIINYFVQTYIDNVIAFGPVETIVNFPVDLQSIIVAAERKLVLAERARVERNIRSRSQASQPLKVQTLPHPVCNKQETSPVEK